MLELAPRLGWRPDPADSITAQAYVRLRRNANLHAERETLGTGTPAAFQQTTARLRERPLKFFADLAWTRQLEGGASLETKLSGYHSRRGADFFFTGGDADGALLETRHVASGPVERDLSVKGTWRRPVGAGHALAAGWEAGHKTRAEFRIEQRVDYRDGAAGVPLPASDERYRASVRRSAFYIQDEWEFDKAWSAYLGLRREDLRTRGGGNAAVPVDVGSGVWSPVAQVLYKARADAQGRQDQFRLAVSRSYKAPDIAQLMPRRYTVDNNNSANNPDQQGNPTLRPELALNIDLAWERYVGKDGMLGVSAFDKHIRDITLDRVFESGGVWTATPVNAGRARVRGVEFEAKGTRGALAGRINVARNWSRLEQVPGPDNRIDGQPAWSGNVGLDYSAGARLEMGGSASYRGHYASRQSAVLAGSGAPRRLLDLYAVWKVDRNARLRLSANDLLHQDNVLDSVYGGDGWRTRSVAIRTHTSWRVVWEQSLQ
jgi:outer membrane receptor protein involved in Fe transport